MSEQLKEGLNYIFSNQTNINIFEKQILKTSLDLEMNPLDILYEIGFLIENENMKIKDVLDMLKSCQIAQKHKNFDIVKKQIEEMDHFIDKNLDVIEGVEKCRYCGENRTMSYTKNTRSSDEGFTVFIYCILCKKRYVMNS